VRGCHQVGRDDGVNVAESGAHVLDGDAIAGADLLEGHAASKAADECTDRHAGAAHHQLSAEYVWPSLKAFTEVHGLILVDVLLLDQPRRLVLFERSVRS
jgi:hypothetical protein